MKIDIKFLGATQTVTGSKYLLKIDKLKLLVDCGLFQGLKENRLLNWEDFPIEPSEIDVVIITHAHIDHTGYLPRLVKNGFSGPIYCTFPTQDLMEIMLRDSARLQQEEATKAREKGYSKHNPPLPLYTEEDVERVLPLLKGYDYQQVIPISERIQLTYQDAGHILGSAIAEINIVGDYQTKKIVFSGDLGRYDSPILYDPTPITQADILVIESTYGDRENPSKSPEIELKNKVLDSLDRDGVLLIPAFAVGRTQTLMYYLRKLIEENQIPPVPIYFDSPMAIDVTKIYKHYRKDYKYQEYENMRMDKLYDFPNFHLITSHQDSYNLTLLKRKAIIISASGMCTGGRVLDHLYFRLRNPQDTVLLVGFQAEGTRGRKLLEGEKSVYIYGEEIPVKCTVEHLNGLSAHADRSELLHWLSHFEHHPKKTFIVHGEKMSSFAFAQTIQDTFGWNVFVPNYLENFELFDGI